MLIVSTCRASVSSQILPLVNKMFLSWSSNHSHSTSPVARIHRTCCHDCSGKHSQDGDARLSSISKPLHMSSLPLRKGRAEANIHATGSCYRQMRAERLKFCEGPLNRQDLITDSGISAGCLDLLPEAAHVVNDHFPSLFRNTANGKLSSLLRNAVNSFYLSTFNHLFSPLISSRSLRRTFLNFFPSTRLFAYPFLDS